MCVIIWQPEGKTVPPEILAEGARCNPDGWGIIGQRLNRRDKLVTTPEHGLDMSDFAKRGADYAGHPALFHCRKQSKGVVDIGNTHPYKIHVPGEPAVWMVHNGTLQIPTTLDETRSDTWHFARFLEKFPNVGEKLKDPEFVKILEWIVGSSKLAFFYENNAILVNEKAGIWRDGCWYSNHSAFLPGTVYSSTGNWQAYNSQRTSGATETSTSSSTSGQSSVSGTGVVVSGPAAVDAAGGDAGGDDAVGEDGGTPVSGGTHLKPTGVLKPLELTDGKEVTLFDGSRFRYQEVDDIFVQVVREDEGNVSFEDQVDEAIDFYVWAKDEPEDDDMLTFILKQPEIAARTLLRLIQAARKFALLDVINDEEDDDDEDEEDNVIDITNSLYDHEKEDPRNDSERAFDYSMGCG